MKVLQVQALSAAAFAPFGQVIEAGASSAGGLPVNAGSSHRFEAVPALDLMRDGGRAALALYDASARSFPFEARGLERHRLSDQVFLPLGGARRCVLLVAAAGAAPAAAGCQAFVSDGTQGVCIRAGTWHHGLLSLDAGPWAVLERRAVDIDCDEAVLDTPVHLSL